MTSDFSSSYSDGATIATLPENYRPNATTDVQVFSTSGTYLGTVRFNTNGTIAPVFGALAAGKIRMSVTYINTRA